MALVFALGFAVVFLSPLIGIFSTTRIAEAIANLRDPLFIKSLIITIESGTIAALFSVMVAMYFGRKFAYSSWRGQRIQELLILLPYLIPNFVLAMSYVVAWNPTTGLLNSIVRFPSGLYGFLGMTYLFGIVHFPVAFIIFEEKLKRIDSSLAEAAALSGASPFGTFVKVELPLMTPTIFSAFGLCFALNISAFAIPAWIGAPKHIYPLTYKIYQSVQLGGLDGISEAANAALVLLILSLLPFLINYFFQRSEKKFVLVTGKLSKRRRVELSPQRLLVFQTFFVLSQLVFWIAPLVCLFFSTVTPPGCLQESGFSCFTQISWSHYKYVLFDLSETQGAFKGSLVFGSISATLICLISIFALMGFYKKKKVSQFIEMVFNIPLATPGALIALGLIIVFSGKYGINLYNTPWIVVFAFVIKHINLCFAPLRAGFSNISTSLSEAARLSGANSKDLWTKIMLPILEPELVGGFFLVLIPIVGELTMSIFLTSPSFRSIGTVLFDLQDYADQASAGSLAIILVLLILIFNQSAKILSRGKLGY